MKREQQREYYARNREKYAETSKAWRIANRERYNQLVNAYYHRHKDRSYARKAVRRAVDNGLLSKPLTCQQCSKECKVEGHHHKGYDKQFWLDIIWLCRECHRKADKLSKEKAALAKCH